MGSSKPSPLWGILSLVLIAGGLVVSAYLLSVHSRLVGDPTVRDEFCSAVFGTGCTETLKGDYSTFLEIPTAGWGIVYFGSLGTLLLLGWTMGAGFTFEASLAAFSLSLAGALVSLGLTSTMLMGEPALCPLCLVVHGLNLSLIYPLRRVVGGSVGGMFSAMIGSFRYVFGAKVDDEERARWKVLGLLTSGLIAVMLYQWVYVRAQIVEAQHQISEVRAQLAEQSKVSVFERFVNATPIEITYRPDDPVRGRADAAITLTMFSDFQCPACRRFEEALGPIMESYPDSLKVVFKHFPLDGKCNTNVEGRFHNRACDAAEASEAARIQGKFWEFHDKVFALDHGADLGVAIDDIAKDLGVDLEQFATDRVSLGVMSRVREDIAQGVSIDVKGTPWIYLNGRLVETLNIQSLRKMIDYELEHVGHSHEEANEATATGRNLFAERVLSEE